MRKFFLFLVPALILGLTLGVCLLRSPSGTETDYVSALMWDDAIYYLSVQEVDPVPADAVVGTVARETDTFPRKNGQANCCPPGTPVARTEEGLAVELDGVWYLCRPEKTAPAD